MPNPLHTLNFLDGSDPPANLDRLHVYARFQVANPASGGTVAALGSITAGTGANGSVGSVTLTPSGGTGSGLVAIATAFKAVSAAVVSGGTSGFATSDTITLDNGVVLTVSAVSSGVVTTANVTTAGSFTTVDPAATRTQTATSGSGVGTTTWTLVYGLGTAQIVNGGAYTVAPSLTASGASLSGASIATGTLGGNGNPVIVGFGSNAPGGAGLALPVPYMVLVGVSQASMHYVVPGLARSASGFSVAQSISGATVAAGSVDVLVVA